MMDCQDRVIWLTTASGVDHAVEDAAMAAGITGQTGEFAAVCGDLLFPGALTVTDSAVPRPGWGHRDFRAYPRGRETVATEGTSP